MIRVVIPGRPVPKARPRINRTSGGVWTPSEKQEIAASWFFLRYRDEFPEGQVKVRMLFLVNKRQRADVTNLTKLYEDAMNRARVWKDDFQAVDVNGRRLVVEDGDEKTVVWAGRPTERFIEFEGAIREADRRGL